MTSEKRSAGESRGRRARGGGLRVRRSGPFTRFATAVSRRTGHPAAFLAAIAIVAVWALTGPVFGFSDTWQLVINTGTTIVTFLMVFVIQNTQNRDTEAIQIKLDELIRANRRAHNALLDLEEMDQRELDYVRSEYERLACEAREASGDEFALPPVRKEKDDVDAARSAAGGKAPKE